MRRLVLALVGVLLASPAAAEPRWLACKFNDPTGKQQNFHMMFDEDRNVASFFDSLSGTMIEGANTFINYQSIRTRFPTHNLTYNRNDGTLGMSPLGGGAFVAGILHGDCRRSPQPPGAPRG